MKAATTFLTAFLIMTTTANAQTQTMNRLTSNGTARTRVLPPLPPGPSPYYPHHHPWWWGYRVYNPWEGVLRGKADVIRAQGQRAKANAEARVTNEEARRKAMENQVVRVQTHLERERMGREQRAAYHAEKRAAIQRTLEKQRAERAAQQAERVVDPATGQIEWPETLMVEEYTDGREQVEELFQKRIQGVDAPEVSDEIKTVSRTMTEQLRSHIREIRTNDYIDARKFLDKLTREAQM